MAFVYLLRCADGSLYCGWTVDVPKRVGPTPPARPAATRPTRRPHALAAAWEVPTHTDARRLEARIKRLPRSEKLRLTDGAPLDGATPVRFASPDALGEVPPATGMAPAFLRSPEKAILDGVREHANVDREHMDNLTDPSAPTSGRTLGATPCCSRSPGPLVTAVLLAAWAAAGAGLLLADLADARHVDRGPDRALPRVRAAASGRRRRRRSRRRPHRRCSAARCGPPGPAPRAPAPGGTPRAIRRRRAPPAAIAWIVVTTTSATPRMMSCRVRGPRIASTSTTIVSVWMPQPRPRAPRSSRPRRTPRPTRKNCTTPSRTIRQPRPE